MAGDLHPRRSADTGPPAARVAGRPGSRTVQFFLPPRCIPPAVDDLDLEKDWQVCIRGEHAWITQTYLHLLRAGHPVRLVTDPSPRGLLVFHSKHRRDLMERISRAPELVLVAVRSDSSDPLFADFEVVQNGVHADGLRRHHLPHWPQPGLQPRHPSRGSDIRLAAYRGYAGNLHPGFRSDRWSELLADEGIAWESDSVPYARSGHQAAPLRWNDFRDVDVLVAVRPAHRRLWPHKPATKLINAWHAGVPAILGPERAYRELREDELDFLEVASPEEAIAAIRRLRAHPELYRSMVANGERRARSFTVERITRRWAHLLFEVIPDIERGRRPRWPKVLSLRQRRLVGRIVKLFRGDPAR